MLLEQSRNSSQESSPVAIRGSSEPPDSNSNYNETNGLRRSRQPIKVAGITMGSTENLVNDELASVFANRRRRRRSATPVKIGGIVMGDDNPGEDPQDALPFGNEHVNKRASYHPGMNGNKRNSSIGMWGQRMFANGHNFTHDSSSSNCSTLERPIRKSSVTKDENHYNEEKHFSMENNNCSTTNSERLDIGDVKQFLTEMHTEINTLTSNAYSSSINTMLEQSSSKESNNEKRSDYSSNNNTTNTNTTTISNKKVEDVEKQSEKTVSVEKTIVIHPNSNDDDEEIIEIEPDQVKYHSGETPHPNRVDPSKTFQVMSEAEDNDDDIIEIEPDEVRYVVCTALRHIEQWILNFLFNVQF